MGETTDQIERHIQATRDNLSENFNELEEKVKSAVDWRAQVEERPGTMMALAFGGGLLLSALLPAARSSRRKSAESRWNGPQDRYAPRVSIASRSAFDDQARQSSGNWDALKGALIGIATTKLTAFIDDLLPGFEQEFTQAQTSNRAERPGQTSSGRSVWQESAARGVD